MASDQQPTDFDYFKTPLASEELENTKKFFSQLKSSLYDTSVDPAPPQTTPSTPPSAPQNLDRFAQDALTSEDIVQSSLARAELNSVPQTPATDVLDHLSKDQTLASQFAQAMSQAKIEPHIQVKISTFSDMYISAKGFLRAKKIDQAQTAYTDMLRIYQELNGLNISPLHKQIAHHGLEEVYEQIQFSQHHESVSRGTFATLIIASVLVMLVGVTLVLNPSISGLAVLEQTIPEYTGATSFEVFGPRRIELGSSFAIPPENLAILATRSEHVDVQLDGTGIIIIPEPGFYGEETISVIGMNTETSPYRLTKVHLSLIVR